MGYYYFDESLQERGEFIVGAFVYSKSDLTPEVYDALNQVGLTPRADEFKSGMRIDNNPERVMLRTHIKSILQKVRIGVVLSPIHLRDELGNEALKALSKIILANNLMGAPGTLYLDMGISPTETAKQEFIEKVGKDFVVHDNQDSKIIGGIQVADLAAHSLGIMLLEQLNLISKTVAAGENSGYPPELQIEIGFELWASLRHSFFMSPHSKEPITFSGPITDYIKARTHNVADYGLYISPSCSESLTNAAISRFGECYLGCIH